MPAAQLNKKEKTKNTVTITEVTLIAIIIHHSVHIFGAITVVRKQNAHKILVQLCLFCVNHSGYLYQNLKYHA